jgi:hypothetical protein
MRGEYIVQMVSNFKYCEIPIGVKSSIVRLIEQFRDYTITETEVHSALLRRGFSNQAAVDYVELITSTRL